MPFTSIQDQLIFLRTSGGFKSQLIIMCYWGHSNILDTYLLSFNLWSDWYHSADFPTVPWGCRFNTCSQVVTTVESDGVILWVLLLFIAWFGVFLMIVVIQLNEAAIISVRLIIRLHRAVKEKRMCRDSRIQVDYLTKPILCNHNILQCTVYLVIIRYSIFFYWFTVFVFIYWFWSILEM